jgi:uncharacterized protein YbjT (DUF2867 family)
MTVLVAGATGALGGRIVQRLRERGERVRCLVRPQADATVLEGLGAEVVRGDLLDPGSLRSACSGVATVVCTATAIARLLADAAGPSLADVDDRGVGSLVAAAEHEGVERFVYLSYAGVDAGLGFPLERAKAANEQRLRQSSLREVIVRPDGFQEMQLSPMAKFDVARGRVDILGRGETRRRLVAGDDVAALVVILAFEPDAPSLLEVGGPDALSRAEAADLAEQISGHELRRRHIPRPAVRLAARLLARPRPALASVFGIGLLMDLQESRCDDTPLRERGIEPQQVAVHLRRQAATRAQANDH